jgi:hypothetical protein
MGCSLADHAQSSPGYMRDTVLRSDILTGTCAMSTIILPMFPLFYENDELISNDAELSN